MDAYRIHKNGDAQDFDTQDVIRGLYGVCVVLDEHTEQHTVPWLASAARVLASTLHHQAEEEADEV